MALRLGYPDRYDGVKDNNLMVFIHPVILPDAQSADAYTRMKYQTIQQQQTRSKVSDRNHLGGGSSILPNMDKVQGTVDSLHNQPQPATARKRFFGNSNNSETTTTNPSSNNTNCHKSDPLCNGSL